MYLLKLNLLWMITYVLKIGKRLINEFPNIFSISPAICDCWF